MRTALTALAVVRLIIACLVGMVGPFADGGGADNRAGDTRGRVSGRAAA